MARVCAGATIAGDSEEDAVFDLRPDAELAHTCVADVMHRGLVTCRPETPLRKLAAMLAAHRIHAVVVADGQGHRECDVWGVVSDLDLVGALVRGAAGETAGSLAATPPCVVVPGEPLSHVARLMARLGVTHVLVIDPADRRPVGVVSTLDVADVLSR